MNLKPLGAKAPGGLISIAHGLKPMAISAKAHGLSFFARASST